MIQGNSCLNFKINICSDTDSPSAGDNQEGIKFKRQLTRGSSEKLMLVNRFKKVSGKGRFK